MVQKLFEDFLDGPDNYAACERHWERVIQEIEESLRQQGEWPRWWASDSAPWAAEFANGAAIIHGRSKKLNRAFKVLQHRPVGDEICIAAWMERNEEEDADLYDLPLEELTVNLSLSVESERVARILLTLWMTPDTSFEGMTRFLDDHLQCDGATCSFTE
jgi:hypothetical protein